MTHDHIPNAPTAITGSCDHCEWHYVATGYPEVVEAYHDHLRDNHPRAWVRA
ncbi:MAG: hypothetical protein ABEI96_03600 [Haloarculaceae archaeon]